MDSQAVTSPAGVPPIVLVVEDDTDTRELYDTALGFAGLWVAQAANMDDALEYAIDLRPDSVLMDVAIPSAGDGFALARALRENSRFGETPIVAVTGLEPGKLNAETGLFTAIFYKPVPLERVVRRVKWLSLKSAVLRERGDRARAQASLVVAKTTEWRDLSPRREHRSSTPLGVSAEASESPAATATVRACPKCRKPLFFSEQRALDGTTFDYYAPCRSGCGLFCYDHSRRRVITLVE